MTRSLKWCVVLAAIVASGERTRAAEDSPEPAKGVAELAPLDNFRGQWDTELTIKTADNAEGTRTKGVSTATWILDGRFLRQAWAIEAKGDLPGLKGESLRTYNPQQKNYRAWSFHSSGHSDEASGAWDEKSRTFTWTTKDPNLGWSTVTTSSFPEDGREEWSIVTKDGEGKLIVEVTGVATRRKL